MTLMSLFRPLAPVELVQWTIRIYRRYWPLWIGLALLALVPLVLLNVALTNILPQPEIDPVLLEQLFQPLESGSPLTEPNLPPDMMKQLLDYSLAALQQIAIGVLAQMVIVGVVAGGAGAVMASAVYHNRPVSLMQALQVGLAERGMMLLKGHMMIGGGLLLLLVISMFGLFLCVGVIGLSLSVYLYLAWIPLLAPALAIGKGSYFDLVRQAWQFGKRRVWLIFGAVVALTVLRFVLSIPVSLVGSLLVGDSYIAAQIISLLVESVTLPLGVIFYTLLFEDMRARRESSDGPLDAAIREAMPREPFFTPADLPTIMAVSMVALGLLVTLYIAFIALSMVAMPGLPMLF